MIDYMLRLAKMVDPITECHQARVAQLSRAVAVQMGLPLEDCEKAYLAGLVHDLGKLAVPKEFLLKQGHLSAAEFEFVKQHVSFGTELLSDLKFDAEVIEAVAQHHERIDGSGYPLSLNVLTRLGKILAVVDVFESMTSNRTYRHEFSDHVAMKEISDAKKFDAKTFIALRDILFEHNFRFDRQYPSTDTTQS